MLEIVYAENSEQFYLMQKTDFMNAVSRFEYTVNVMSREQILLILQIDFINAEKQIRSICNLNMKKR